MNRIIAIAIMLICTKESLADWPVVKGRSVIIPSYNYFYSSKYFDSSGKTISFNQGDHFISHSFSLYMSHGITRKLDLFASIPFTSISSSFNGVQDTKSGITDCQVGFAYHFPFKDLKHFITAKALFIFPAYQNLTTPYLGYGSKGFQFALNYSFNPLPHTFLIAESSFTRYSDSATGPNQFGYNITGGTMFLDYNYVTINLAGVISNSIDKAFNSNLLINKDFSYGKIAIAYGRRVTRIATPYIQAFYTLYGRNAGVGLGGSVYVIFKLP